MNYSIATRTVLFVAFVAINTSVFGPSISSIRDVFAKSSNREYYLFGLYPSDWLCIGKQTSKVSIDLNWKKVIPILLAQTAVVSSFFLLRERSKRKRIERALEMATSNNPWMPKRLDPDEVELDYDSR